MYYSRVSTPHNRQTGTDIKSCSHLRADNKCGIDNCSNTALSLYGMTKHVILKLFFLHWPSHWIMAKCCMFDMWYQNFTQRPASSIQMSLSQV